MYSPEEIKVALRKYIASTGDTSIDEQSIINILDQGADRDFNMVAPTIKSIRENYGVKKSIPMWLRMLTFRLIYDCMASDADCNSEMTWYKLLGYENKVRELFCNIGVNQNIQNLLLSAKGDKIKIDTILLDMVLGKESSQIIKELQKNNIKDSIKEKLNEIGIAQDVQDMLWEVQAKKGSTKEKQIKETLIKSALGSDYEQVYNLLLSQAKSQENLLKALGFNKKVFDSTSSWQMYSPEMKLRQSRFDPVNFPFSYAEVESNPIYVAMLHHLISEARVLTDTFVDVFGKMGTVPAFCANGYTHKLLYSVSSDTEYSADVFQRYYLGITCRPTNAYTVLQSYMIQIQDVIASKLGENDRDLRIKKIVSDEALILGLASNSDCNYAVAKFCDMCFRKSYWEDRNIDKFTKDRKERVHLITDNASEPERAELIGTDNLIVDDYSSIKRAKRFVDISKDNFLVYAQALKKVKYIDKSDLVFNIFYNNSYAMNYYEDYNFSDALTYDIEEMTHSKTPLLYVDIPKFGEFKRFEFSFEKQLIMLEGLSDYKGDWILTWKNYKYDYFDSKQRDQIKELKEVLRRSERPLYIFSYKTEDTNVRNGISFITTINFDYITEKEFKNKYNIELTHGEKFQKHPYK